MIIETGIDNHMSNAMTKERPLGVTVIAILVLFGAVMAFMYALQMLHILPVFLGPVAFYTFSLFGAIMWGILAFIYLWLFKLLWDMQPQGWMFALLLSAFNLFFILLSVLGASSWEAMAPGILINGLILIYCLLPGTKQAFGIPQ